MMTAAFEICSKRQSLAHVCVGLVPIDMDCDGDVAEGVTDEGEAGHRVRAPLHHAGH